MNKSTIEKLVEMVAELEARSPRVCQDFNASLMLRGAIDLLAEADAGRAKE